MLADEPSPGAAGSDNEIESMLSTQGLEPAAAPTASGLDFNMDFDAQHTGASDVPAESSLEMSLDMDSEVTPPADSSASSFDMDFNLGAPGTDESSSTMIDFNTSGTQDFSSGLDFTTSDASPSAGGDAQEFSLGGMSDAVAEAETAPSAGAATEEGMPGWDETATKLDLAKAYIDMGDSEGARSILDEVIAEGNESQKQQAKSLAAQIAA